MSKTSTEKRPESRDRDRQKAVHKGLMVARGVAGAGAHPKHRTPQKILEHAVRTGLKLAASDVFHDPAAPALRLAAELKKLGPDVMFRTPETLFSLLDQKFSGWSRRRAADAILKFHDTGAIQSDIPVVVRNKIYAIRIVYTSESAHTDWHIFEKIGGAFNDRAAKFSEYEPLSAAECAKTVAIIENLRPDDYSNEIKIYVANCCHHSGLYTVEPCEWLRMAEKYLQRFNFEATGDHADSGLKKAIIDRYQEWRPKIGTLLKAGDDVISVQALKLLGIHHLAEESIRG